MLDYEARRIQENGERQKREAAFDLAVEDHLDRLSRINTLDELMAIIRNAAIWALELHRAEMRRKARR